MSYELFRPERLASVWGKLGLAWRPSLFDVLRERYAEPHRAYHTARHIDECLAHLDRIGDECGQPAEVEVALWFHDAIYDTRAHDNEQRSAEWAAGELAAAGAAPAVSDSVRSLVLATRHDGVPASSDARYLVDIDLSILGASRDRFLEYETQIRTEYAWVPDAVFRHERAKLLRRFLSQPPIYKTALFRELLEENAQSNLAFSLELLA
jgi:predicted metal-dependent HD superfamily phosphohydrolase